MLESNVEHIYALDPERFLNVMFSDGKAGVMTLRLGKHYNA
jgi:hypothetical protein